jgi:hypothetical protein
MHAFRHNISRVCSLALILWIGVILLNPVAANSGGSCYSSGNPEQSGSDLLDIIPWRMTCSGELPNVRFIGDDWYGTDRARWEREDFDNLDQLCTAHGRPHLNYGGYVRITLPSVVSFQRALRGFMSYAC